ncbi:hypothetical protein H483_0115670 [Dietzia sp. UCD-THP]|uniref:DUF732 domain-containing protein n=1 Tax=Dietzia sp. UCD-THP TaxID=1292020 RepID=UPI00037FFE1C|nr:DUF732 domain-containing protein [Dietzia sp. UCD-THP]EYT57312.1 hypothetical protein H483_0115670 [Dietzia sp. UCD-THP]
MSIDAVTRFSVATVVCAFLAVSTGCAAGQDATDRTVRADTMGQGADAADAQPAGTAGGPARTGSEQDFLDQLTASGLPTEMTAATTVEVGLGICRSISDGADTETILDHLRPLTSAIAAQDADRDTAGVGRALIDASRAHLCG